RRGGAGGAKRWVSRADRGDEDHNRGDPADGGDGGDVDDAFEEVPAQDRHRIRREAQAGWDSDGSEVSDAGEDDSQVGDVAESRPAKKMASFNRDVPDEFDGGSEDENGQESSAASDFDDSDDDREISKSMKEANKKHKKSGGFQSMGLSYPVYSGIIHKGYKIPTPIQRKAIPVIMDKRDVVAMARTGSGKTAAFVIPLLERLRAHSSIVGARALILTPSRELAFQTLKFAKELGKHMDLRSCVLVGGDRMDEQFAAIATNPDIIIATPGRLMHLIIEMNIELKTVEYVVFDEADRLFELGFAEQLREILFKLPEARQTLLFSATLPKVLVDFAKAGLSEPALIRLDVETRISPDLQMMFFNTKHEDKDCALIYLLSTVIPKDQQTIIFVATKHLVEYIHELLNLARIKSTFIFGSLDQVARKMHIAKFRSGDVKILVVTDVAARGIDIPMLDNVINYDFPGSSKLPYLLDFQLFTGHTDRERVVTWLQDNATLQSLATIFEVGRRGIKSSEALLMQSRRRQLGNSIREKRAKIEGLQDENLARQMNALNSSANSFVSEPGFDEITSKKRKRDASKTSSDHRDPEFFMSHFPQDYVGEKGYAVNGSSSKGSGETSFNERAEQATLEIQGDDDEALRTKRKKGSLQWDKKLHRFVRDTVGSDNRKRIKTDSGATVLASFKTNRAGAALGMRTFRHNKITAANPNSKNFARKMAAAERIARLEIKAGVPEAQRTPMPTAPVSVPSAGSRPARSELKSASEVSKARKIKEKRRLKTGRHGGKGKGKGKPRGKG
ncbi:ATP-dependent RNA helicase ddx54, partial [Cladochytrium tenue]